MSNTHNEPVIVETISSFPHINGIDTFYLDIYSDGTYGISRDEDELYLNLTYDEAIEKFDELESEYAYPNSMPR